MNSRLTHLASFLAGTVFGGAVIWQFVKRKYESIAEEEIRSVKETYSRRNATVVTPAHNDNAMTETAAESVPQPKESVLDYAARLRSEGYLSYESDNERKEKIVSADAPYIILPDEFGEYDSYATISFTFYSDGTLADENDEVLENAEDIVGSDFHNHFGEYEDDSVFVRNDRLKCDYEILFDQRPYSEVLKAKPYLRRGD